MEEDIGKKIDWIREELKHIRLLSLTIITLCLSILYLCVTASNKSQELSSNFATLSKAHLSVGKDFKASEVLTKKLHEHILRALALRDLNTRIYQEMSDHPELSFAIPNYGLNSEVLKLVEVNKMSMIETRTVEQFLDSVKRDWYAEYVRLIKVTKQGDYQNWNLSSGRVAEPPKPTGYQGKLPLEATKINLDYDTKTGFIVVVPLTPVREETELRIDFTFETVKVSSQFIQDWFDREFGELKTLNGMLKSHSIESAKQWSKDEFYREINKVELTFLSFTVRGDTLATYVPWVLFVLLLHFTTYFRCIRRYVIESNIHSLLSPTLHASKGIINRVLSGLTLIFLPMLTLSMTKIYLSLEPNMALMDVGLFSVVLISGLTSWFSGAHFYDYPRSFRKLWI